MQNFTTSNNHTNLAECLIVITGVWSQSRVGVGPYLEGRLKLLHFVATVREWFSPFSRKNGFRKDGYTVKILKFGTPQRIAIPVLKIEKFDVTLH